MTQEEKQLLLEDLCTRLPYDIKIDYEGSIYYLNEINPACKNIDYITVLIQDENRLSCADQVQIDKIKPYLRPMSSMTNDEKRKLQSFYPGCFGGQWLDIEKGTIDIFECSSTITLYLNDSERLVNWLNKKMFDCRGLIPMGLALEALEGMYNINEK